MSSGTSSPNNLKGSVEIVSSDEAASTTALTITGSVIVAGDMTVQGVTTTIQSSTLTIDDKNIELGDVAQITGLTATLSTGTANVTVTSTSGLVPGMTLTKTAGTGTFNASSPTISSITSATVFVASGNHAGAGAITFTAGGASDVTADGGGITLKGASDKTIVWANDTDAWEFNQSILPDSDSQLDLGTTAIRWRNIYADDVYTGDLHLSNERGDWTVIEEENYLTIRNNKNGKRYKLLMEELPEDED
tara:strand:+ start:358 stop:1104 length:747 start_codon:yes stop_codon:yes gene_type:complete